MPQRAWRGRATARPHDGVAPAHTGLASYHPRLVCCAGLSCASEGAPALRADTYGNPCQTCLVVDCSPRPQRFLPPARGPGHGGAPSCCSCRG